MSSLGTCSSFAAAGLDDAHLALNVNVLLRHLSFDVFVVLVLAAAVCLRFALRFTLNHVTARRGVLLATVGIVFEVVGEPTVLACSVLLIWVCGVVLIRLAWDTRQLLLRLRCPNAIALHSRLDLLILTG